MKDKIVEWAKANPYIIGAIVVFIVGFIVGKL